MFLLASRGLLAVILQKLIPRLLARTWTWSRDALMIRILVLLHLWTLVFGVEHLGSMVQSGLLLGIVLGKHAMWITLVLVRYMSRATPEIAPAHLYPMKSFWRGGAPCSLGTPEMEYTEVGWKRGLKVPSLDQTNPTMNVRPNQSSIPSPTTRAKPPTPTQIEYEKLGPTVPAHNMV